MHIRTMILLLGAAIASSGCTDAGGAATTPSPTLAAEPTVAPSYGSIHGTVLNDEQVPLAGADVVLLGTPRQTQTDKGGAFTFNELEGGEYSIVVQKLGFKQASKKVSVVAGEVTEAKISLESFVIADEPYYVMLPRKTLVEVGFVLLDNRIPNGYSYCKSCDHYLSFTPGPKALRLDQTFTNGVSIPNDDIWIDFRINWGNATGAHSQSDGSSIGSGYLKDRTPWNGSETAIKSIAKLDKIWYHVTGGLMPSVNRKIDSYITFAYHAELPDDYSALPPK